MEDLVYMVGSQSLLYCIIMEYEILKEASWYSPYMSQTLNLVDFEYEIKALISKIKFTDLVAGAFGST